MPRGVKKQVNYDEKLAKIDARIIHHKNSITELEEEKKLIFIQKEEAELKELQSLIVSSGKTPAEFLAAIKQSGATTV